MTNIWLGLFSGIAFGFVIQRIGATDAHRTGTRFGDVVGQCRKKRLTKGNIS